MDHHRVLEFDSQVYVPFDQDGRLVGSRVHQPIHFLTPPDCASSLWSRWLSEGQSLEQLVFKFTTVDRAGMEVVFFEIDLRQALLVSRADQWSFDTSQTRELPQGLRLGLMFEEICWRFLDGNIEECDRWSEPPLSVALIYFEAIPDGADVHLRWGVPSLETVTGYEVLHRSPESNDFQSLVYLDAIHDNGVTEYETTVRNLDYGKHAFRLKEVKVDGAVDYSPAIEVDVRASPLVYRLNGPYPNPTRGTANLSLVLGKGQVVEIVLFDVLGREAYVLHEGFLAGETLHPFRLDMPEAAASGLYGIRVVGEDFQTSETFVRTR